MEKFFITFQEHCYFFKTDENLKKIENRIQFIYEKYSFYFQKYNNNNSILVSHDKIFLLIIFDLLSEEEQKNMNYITFDDNIINVNDQNKGVDTLLFDQIKEIHSFYKILLD